MLRLRCTFNRDEKVYEDTELVSIRPLESEIKDFSSWIEVQTYLGNKCFTDVIYELVNVEPVEVK